MFGHIHAVGLPMVSPCVKKKSHAHVRPWAMDHPHTALCPESFDIRGWGEECQTLVREDSRYMSEWLELGRHVKILDTGC